MSGWISTSPNSWAEALGMVAVPLFGERRENKPVGSHNVLLDGDRASFALSIGNIDELLDHYDPSSWSWSSNLNHSLILDPDGQELVVCRWDRPGEERRGPVPERREVTDFLRALASEPAPTAETVIRKMIRVFRNVRHNIEPRGTHLDSIRAFNTLLAWADATRQGRIESAHVGDPTLLREIVPILVDLGLINFNVDDLSPSARTFPVVSLLDEILKRDPRTKVVLDPDLFIRHASGRIYQEAHRDLSRTPIVGSTQLTFFGEDVSYSDAPPRGDQQRDAHFTPSSLARLLVQEAIRVVREIRGSASDLTVLDPACGSGVFLIEAARETEASEPRTKLREVGIDRSEVSIEMTRFCLSYLTSDDEAGRIEYRLSPADSLEPRTKWGKPDIILMNPPFISWEKMSSADKVRVASAMGDRHARLADASFAFVAKAIDTLKAARGGTAIATVVPASFLNGAAAKSVREDIQRDRLLSVRLIGMFRGLDYFDDAMVEPAFLVIAKESRSSCRENHPVRFLVAESGHEDEAIRALRLKDATGTIASDGWEIFDVDASELRSDSWLPVARRPAALLRALSKAGIPRVSDLFNVNLNVQTGSKKIFTIDKNDVETFANDPGFSRLFRPVIGEVRRGVIHEGGYVFYPYGRNGDLIFGDEDELVRDVPTFFKKRLEPNREELPKRTAIQRQGKPWWALNWPRASWAIGIPKIVTPQFGERGSFAYDEVGRYVVLQGNAWFWKAGAFDGTDLPWAYLAVLNSSIFWAIVGQQCPRVAGGQYNINKHYVKDVPLPNLSDRVRIGESLFRDLVAQGRTLVAGLPTNSDELDRLTAAAYGMPLSQIRAALMPEVVEAAELRFRQLYEEWRHDTASSSSVRTKTQHPAYRKIVAMGEQAIPFILAELRERPSHVFWALAEITGENPLSLSSAGKVMEMIATWLEWGRAKGYES